MKAKLIFIVVIILVVSGLSLFLYYTYFQSEDLNDFVVKMHSHEKFEALREIEALAAEAEFHRLRLEEISKLVLTAKSNLPVIVEAGRLISQTGSHTRIFIEIARIAAEIEYESPELHKLLDYAAVDQSKPAEIVKLAEQIRDSKTQEERNKIARMIDDLIKNSK
jgi:hypothetical protein